MDTWIFNILLIMIFGINSTLGVIEERGMLQFKKYINNKYSKRISRNIYTFCMEIK